MKRPKAYWKGKKDWDTGAEITVDKNAFVLEIYSNGYNDLKVIRSLAKWLNRVADWMEWVNKKR